MIGDDGEAIGKLDHRDHAFVGLEHGQVGDIGGRLVRVMGRHHQLEIRRDFTNCRCRLRSPFCWKQHSGNSDA